MADLDGAENKSRCVIKEKHHKPRAYIILGPNCAAVKHYDEQWQIIYYWPFVMRIHMGVTGDLTQQYCAP